MKFAILAAAFLVATATAPFAHADSLYDVTGSMSLQGNGQNMETVNFSFTFDEAASPYGGYYLSVEDPSLSSTGPLAPATEVGVGQDRGAYVAFLFGPPTPGVLSQPEVDAFLNFNQYQAQLVTPEFAPDGVQLYSCWSNAVCKTDFCPPSQFGCGTWPAVFGSIQATVVPAGDPPSDPPAMPEPATFLLLGASMPILFFKIRKQFYSTALKNHQVCSS